MHGWDPAKKHSPASASMGRPRYERKADATNLEPPTVGNGGSDEIATISCNNEECVEAGKAGCVGDGPPSLCNDPMFLIDRYARCTRGLHPLKKPPACAPQPSSSTSYSFLISCLFCQRLESVNQSTLADNQPRRAFVRFCLVELSSM